MRTSLCRFTLLALCLVGCHFQSHRLKKALTTREQVFDSSFSLGAPLIQVQYRPDKKSHFSSYLPRQDPETGRQRPPQIYGDSAILLEVAPGVDPSTLRLQTFIKHDSHDAGDLVEVHTLVGEIPGAIENSVAFVEDLFPGQTQRLLLYPDDLSGPFQGTTLYSYDWLVLKVSSPTQTQKFIFEYVSTGLRVGASAQLLVSSGVNLLDLGVAQIESSQQNLKGESRRSELASSPGQIDPSQLNLAFTFTMAFGYRSKSDKRSHWVGDNLSLVLDLGVGNPGEIQAALFDGSAADRAAVLQNQLLFGAGLQLFDFVSLHFIGNSLSVLQFPRATEVETILIPELGVDVGSAIRFSSNLYQRLFTSTARRSHQEPPLPALLSLPASAPSSAPASTP